MSKSKLKIWSTVSSKVVYKNPWIKVREDKYVRPDGKVGVYGVVEANPAIGVLPISKGGSVFLLKQYRYPVSSYSWEIVSGGIEKGETELSAAKRELKEEAGLAAKKWTYLGNFWLSDGITDQEDKIYLAEQLTYVPKKPEGSEKFLIKKFSFKETLRMVEEGTIRDSCTMIAIYKLKSLLNS